MTAIPSPYEPPSQTPEGLRRQERDRLRRLVCWCLVAVVFAALVFYGPSDAAVTTW